MGRTSVCLLWHMHQPLYRIDGEAVAYLPWVRLHAVRSYYDMVRVLEEFPEVRVTINLTPVLIEQIRAYEKGGSDAFLETAGVPAEELSDHQRRFLFRNFFVCNAERMIRPLPAFAALWTKRQAALRARGTESAWRELSTDDFRNLQALYDLCWFGFKAAEDFPRIKELRSQERFSDADVAEVHEIARKVLGRVLPLHAEAAARGQITLTTTPYYHPILPLLIDTDVAREAAPEAPLPPRFRAPEDAAEHVRRALAYVESELGVRPKGMWPAEGGLSDDAARLFAESGVRWVAGDEEVLAHSERKDGASPYRPWSLDTGRGELKLVFRDHDLSDRIGFRYQNWHATDAVGDLLHALEHHVRKFDKKDDFVLIALDGENPWEHYPDAGSYFLRELYRRLSKSETLKADTLDAAVAARKSGRLTSLHAGSWIYASFSTWIGAPQKNRAWEILASVRAALRAALSKSDARPAGREAAERSLLAAEGSDWWWWLDGQFESLYIPEFEALFRGHLARAFERIGEPVPEVLTGSLLSTLSGKATSGALAPSDWVNPRLDGRRSNALEWHGAVRLGWPNVRAEGAMQRAHWPLGALWIGFARPDRLSLRIDPARLEPQPTWFDEVAVEAHEGNRTVTLTIRFSDSGRVVDAVLDGIAGGRRTLDLHGHDVPVRGAAQDILELCVASALLGVESGAEAELRLRLRSGADVIALRPLRVRAPAFDLGSDA